MKLKSKLIATIVSICAAIAVMGVGVWAATDDFTVTVTNTVNIAISNLSGKVTVATEAKVDGSDAGYTELDPETTGLIFDSEGAATGVQDATAIINSQDAAEHQYEGADLFTKTADGGKITNTVKSATLKYTFVYTPHGTPAGKTKVTITPTTLPNDTTTNVMSYTYKINGAADATALAQGTPVVEEVAATETITIEIVATYTNEHLVSTVVNGNFVFSILFESVNA